MKRSKFNLSHYKLMTCDMGELIPIACVPVLPADSVQHHTNVLVRVSPLAAPVMHPVTARVHHFFVPNRLLMDGWEDFITGGPDGDDTTAIPTYSSAATTGTVSDHLGIPPVAGIDINKMPLTAYNKIFNEYYRDQDLVTERPIGDNSLANIAWEKDYFSAGRPWTQKGPDVTIPLGTVAPVMGIGIDGDNFDTAGKTVYETGQSASSTFANSHESSAGSTGNMYFEEDPANAGYPGIYADLANATGANINDVRRAFAIQRYQEARSRYGSRFTEYLRYLGVRNPSDQRLQRPEYLGGGQAQINFSEVMQTAPETGVAPSNEYGVGDMYGHGIVAMKSNAYRRYFEEHGYVITMFSARPKAIYQDGIHREFLKTSKEDYFQRELSAIGQQEVYLNECYADSTNGMDTFSYQDRYMEYREHPSQVSGEFRDTLDYWHMARQFASAPSLNSDFVTCDPTKRIYNEQTTNSLWVMAQHKMVARRIVPRNATPRLF